MKRPQIRGFNIESKLGESECCVVYRAIQQSLSRPVALKVLREEQSSNSAQVAKFKLQSHATEHFRHENIVQTYAAGEQEGLHYVAREILDGKNVARLTTRHHPLPFNRAIDILGQAVDALEAAWKHGGLLHANLKPENIIVCADGAVKLTDFSGITEQSSETLLSALAGTEIGAAAYLAPEVFSRNSGIDFRADIYALGAILYRMITGRSPFEHLPLGEISIAQIESFIPNPLNIDRGISTAASVLAQKMMIKDVKGRYDSWDALRFDISRVSSRSIPARGNLQTHESTIADYAGHPAELERRRRMASQIKFAVIYIAIIGFAILNTYLILELLDFFGPTP